jgi:hypothetical protein
MKAFAKGFASVIAAAMLLLTIGHAIYTANAQSGGGFPSLPRFQGVGVGENAVSGSIRTTGSIVGNTIQANSGALVTANGFGVGGTPSTSTPLLIKSGANVALAATNTGVEVGTLTSTGLGSINDSSGYFVNGVQLPRTSWGDITQTSATVCSASGGSNIASVSCTTSGNVTVTFSTAYTSTPTCTMTANTGDSNQSGVAIGSTVSASSVQILQFESQSPGTAVLVQANLICVGT